MLSKRGEVNVVATMLIFALMISSLGVLYSQISPTLLGYQSRTSSANQEFLMKTIGNEVMELSTAASGSQRRVHVFSQNTEYDVDSGFSLTTNVVLSPSTVISHSEDIGRFMGFKSGAFQKLSEPTYLNRVFNEDSYLNNGSDQLNPSYVIQAMYTTNEGNFTLYFRSWINVANTNSGWLMSIIFLQIDFIRAVDGTPLDFPVNRDEWTLRLKRGASSISETSTTVPAGVTSISVNHTVGGNQGTSYNYDITGGEAITIRFITIPILFTI